MPTIDAAALRAALERQQRDLAPIARVIAALAAFPPRLRPEDWRGESADACERLEQRLRHELRAADAAVSAVERETRIALAEVTG